MIRNHGTHIKWGDLSLIYYIAYNPIVLVGVSGKNDTEREIFTNEHVWSNLQDVPIPGLISLTLYLTCWRVSVPLWPLLRDDKQATYMRWGWHLGDERPKGEEGGAHTYGRVCLARENPAKTLGGARVVLVGWSSSAEAASTWHCRPPPKRQAAPESHSRGSYCQRS